jgi:enoyl-CoA hydratase/carnithine racemase
MGDIHIRKQGHIGRITLNRPKALNALTYEMLTAIEAALDAWREDGAVQLVLIDANGARAFCAGGDIQEMYDTGRAGDYAYGRQFWADEYRLNAKIARYPKPYVALMQGFTMGGGVGVSCHGSHRVVGESSQIAMPECGIGLVPDVGGSALLARAPGRLGEYLGTTATRMAAADAIHAGFADYFIPEADWLKLTEGLVETGAAEIVKALAKPPPDGSLESQQAQIDLLFSAKDIGGIYRALTDDTSDLAASALKSLSRNSPLSMGVTVEIIHRLRGQVSVPQALALEYRFTYRSMERGDFIEGIRAAIIDKDRNPRWKHDSIAALKATDIAAMLAPLGDNELDLKETGT